MNSLKRNQVWMVVSGQYIVVLWSMWWTFWKESNLQGCVWSLHCCLVKYVMNSLKRNLGWRVVFGQYIVVLWSMWWTVWKEIWFAVLCLVTTLLSCKVCDEHFEKKSGLKGCVWSIHCCLVKYVMNSLKRNLVWWITCC